MGTGMSCTWGKLLERSVWTATQELKCISAVPSAQHLTKLN